jgi:hypothetical protein
MAMALLYAILLIRYAMFYARYNLLQVYDDVVVIFSLLKTTGMRVIHQILQWYGGLLQLSREETRIWQWKQSRLRRFSHFPDLLPGV